MKIVCPSHKPEILEQNLLKSKWILDHKEELIVLDNIKHFTKEFNLILNRFPDELIMFVHNDVYLPDSFEEQLNFNLEQLNDKQWGVLGVAGVDHFLQNKGFLRSSGDIWGKPIDTVTEVTTVDELLFIVNNTNNIRFDENITNHHLFATDFCLTCRLNGYQPYVGPLFVYHNSTGSIPDSAYEITAQYISSKWYQMKPFGTTSRFFR